MRWAVLVVLGLLGGGAQSQDFGDPRRPMAWGLHTPEIYLAEAVARGGRVVSVLSVPSNLATRHRSAGGDWVPVFFVELQGRVLRCTDQWIDFDEPPRRGWFPAPCAVALLRDGATAPR